MKIAIVGSGLYGATIAAALSPVYQVTVFEKRPHTGGNVYTSYDDDYGHISEHGAHIFHTNDERVWKFVNKHASFNDYQHYVMGQLPGGNLVDLPFNLSLFEHLVGVRTPAELSAYLANLPKIPGNDLESHCISMVGPEVYNAVVKNYTEKQWGRPCSQLPKSIIARLPVRVTRDRTYFKNAKYQGMPIDGYTSMISSMLKGVPVVFADIGFDEMKRLHYLYDHVFFSGAIDRLLEYDLGILPYRGLRFEHRRVYSQYVQGAPVVNDLSTSMKTRTIEHKLFYPEDTKLQNRELSMVTDEYPTEWTKGDEPYYPIRDSASSSRHMDYLRLAADNFPKMTVGGRLGAYQYYDMDQVIAMALHDCTKF